jgi:hypothetical protein
VSERLGLAGRQLTPSTLRALRAAPSSVRGARALVCSGTARPTSDAVDRERVDRKNLLAAVAASIVFSHDGYLLGERNPTARVPKLTTYEKTRRRAERPRGLRVHERSRARARSSSRSPRLGTRRADRSDDESDPGRVWVRVEVSTETPDTRIEEEHGRASQPQRSLRSPIG